MYAEGSKVAKRAVEDWGAEDKVVVERVAAEQAVVGAALGKVAQAVWEGGRATEEEHKAGCWALEEAVPGAEGEASMATGLVGLVEAGREEGEAEEVERAGAGRGGAVAEEAVEKARRFRFERSPSGSG